MKTKRTAGIIAALAAASAMSVSVGAQNIIDDVIDGAENVIDDTADAAENIVSGGNGPTIGDSSVDDDPDGWNEDDDSLIDDTDDDDIPDQVEDDYDDDSEHPNPGKDENTVLPETDEEDPNPATGVPLMTAGLVALSAAGVAYLTKKRTDEINAD